MFKGWKEGEGLRRMGLSTAMRAGVRDKECYPPPPEPRKVARRGEAALEAQGCGVRGPSRPSLNTLLAGSNGLPCNPG